MPAILPSGSAVRAPMVAIGQREMLWCEAPKRSAARRQYIGSGASTKSRARANTRSGRRTRAGGVPLRPDLVSRHPAQLRRCAPSGSGPTGCAFRRRSASTPPTGRPPRHGHGSRGPPPSTPAPRQPSPRHAEAPAVSDVKADGRSRSNQSEAWQVSSRLRSLQSYSAEIQQTIASKRDCLHRRSTGVAVIVDCLGTLW